MTAMSEALDRFFSSHLLGYTFLCLANHLEGLMDRKLSECNLRSSIQKQIKYAYRVRVYSFLAEIFLGLVDIETNS
jgi:hypothetical protein